MEKENYFEDDDLDIKPPYWWIEYRDDWGYKHIATTKNKNYVSYIENQYTIENVKEILPQ